MQRKEQLTYNPLGIASHTWLRQEDNKPLLSTQRVLTANRMQNKLKTYLVGGAVRDRLLGIEVKDRDYVVVGATPKEMKALGFQQVGADFPVFLHPDTHEEYALARTERKTGEGYHGFSVDFSPEVSLEEDLLRRDLTINAMAEDASGKIIDPYDGLADLRKKKLRHVSTAFREDPVRILRTARFAARFNQFGFEIATETLILMTEMVNNGEAGHLVTERVWQEWQTALAGSDPQIFIQVLRQCSAYQVIAPELDQRYDIDTATDENPGKHGELALTVAATLSPKGDIRFAALLCASTSLDAIAQPEAIEWGNHLCQRLSVPKNWQQLTQLAIQHHATCHQALTLDAGSLSSLLEATDAFRRPQRFDDFIIACEADFRARNNLSSEENCYPQATRLRQALALAAAVEVGPLIDQGLKGPAIKSALHDLRVQALELMTATKRIKDQPV